MSTWFIWSLQREAFFGFFCFGKALEQTFYFSICCFNLFNGDLWSPKTTELMSDLIAIVSPLFAKIVDTKCHSVIEVFPWSLPYTARFCFCDVFWFFGFLCFFSCFAFLLRLTAISLCYDFLATALFVSFSLKNFVCLLSTIVTRSSYLAFSCFFPIEVILPPNFLCGLSICPTAHRVENSITLPSLFRSLFLYFNVQCTSTITSVTANVEASVVFFVCVFLYKNLMFGFKLKRGCYCFCRLTALGAVLLSFSFYLLCKLILLQTTQSGICCCVCVCAH